MKTILRIGIVVVLLCLIAVPIQAQDKEKKETPYWYYSFVKLENYAKLADFRKLHHEYIFDIVKEAKKQGTLLEYKFMVHDTGDIYDLVVARKFPSWCAMNDNWVKKAFDAIEDDEDKRKLYYDNYNAIMNTSSHYDGIYIEVE